MGRFQLPPIPTDITFPVMRQRANGTFYIRHMTLDEFHRTKATGDDELPRPRPPDRTVSRREDPGEDPKGEGDSPTRSSTQGEQYPGKQTRATSAGLASDAAKRIRRSAS